MLSRITFLEKFEKIYLTIYYKHNMLLILTFDSEKQADEYMKTLKKLVDFYVGFKFRIKKYEIIDKRNTQQDLKEIFIFNHALKYRFIFPTSLLSTTKNCASYICPSLEFSNIAMISIDLMVQQRKEQCEIEGISFNEEEFLQGIKLHIDAKFQGTVMKKRVVKIVRRKSSDILKNYEFRNLKTDKEKAIHAIEKMRS